MNTCRVPYLEMSPSVLHSGSYIGLFSASKHLHCALVVCDSKSVTVAFQNTFLNIHQCSVLTVLFVCYIAGAT